MIATQRGSRFDKLELVALILSMWAGSIHAASPPDGEVSRIRLQRFDVHFQVADSASIQAVDLWYTADAGRTWKRHDIDPPRRSSPVPFVAPREGLYGLYVIVHNESGSSSPPPKEGTEPQQWVFVDWTPPLVQLHVAQKDMAFASTRRVALRWTAYDAHILARPIDVYYRVQDQRLWIPVELHLPNSGRYDWQVPPTVGGTVVIKLVVSDRGGHVVERFSEPLEIDSGTVPTATGGAEDTKPDLRPRVMVNRGLILDSDTEPSLPQSAGAGTPAGPDRSSDSATTKDSKAIPNAPRPDSGSRRKVGSEVAGEQGKLQRPETTGSMGPATRPSADATRGKRLHEIGTWHRERGELAIAVSRLKEAVEADPTRIEAQQELAGLLMVQGKPAEATVLYRSILKQQPDHREAQKGLALALVGNREYTSARRVLMEIAATDDHNADAWLQLGDVCFLMGDRDAARDYWTKASKTDARAVSVIDMAQKRLVAYPPLSLAQE